MKRRRLTAGLLLAWAALALTVCTTPTEQSATLSKVTAIATFYPLEYLAQRIGSDRLAVSSLVPPGVEAHDFEPSPQDMSAIQKASLFLYNGAGLEPWATRVVATLSTNGPVSVNATQGLSLRRASRDGEGGDGLDTHVWLDPHRYSQQAQIVHDALVRVDPSGAALYDANLANLQADLANLETELAKGLASCARNTIITTHSAFGYLAERFGLRQLALAGLSPEVEPSPFRMKEIVQEIRAAGATHIFFETLASPAIAQAVARETGAKTLVLNPLEGLTPEQLRAGEDYFTVTRQNLANLRTALECQ